MAGFLIFMLGPMIYSIVISFTDWNAVGTPNFIGFQNYISLFQDSDFWTSLFNTVFYMIGIPIGIVLALLFALALNRKIPGVRAFRTIFYIPCVSSAVAISVLWQWIWNYDYGLVNSTLAFFHIQGPAWLTDVSTTKWALIIMMVWSGLGNSIVLFLAGLQSVPKVYYEAAEIDGANAWSRLRHITIPLISPITFYIIVTNLIGGFQLFTQIIIIMGADGGTSYCAATTVMYLYKKAFTDFQMGYACSISWILSIFIFIITIAQFSFSNKWVNTEN